MISVMLVDDHKILISGLADMINKSGIATVSGICFDATSCRRSLKNRLPDVLILDINLPDVDGVAFCQELKESYPDLKILALSSYHEIQVVRRMLENGANGYLLKSVIYEELIEGICAVANGETFICRDLRLPLKKQEQAAIWLSSREKEILKLIVEGYTNPQIADKLFLSPDTIKGYRKSLLFKLGAKNTAMLVKLALEQKLTL